MPETVMDKLVSLAKRRGFIFPSSEIYGGFSNTYDYGPLGMLLKTNVKAVLCYTLIFLNPSPLLAPAVNTLHP